MKHLNEIKMTYFQHWQRAMLISVKLFYASIILVIHAFLPFLFEKTASNIVKNIFNDI